LSPAVSLYPQCKNLLERKTLAWKNATAAFNIQRWAD